MESFYFNIDSNNTDLRIDSFLNNEVENISRNALQKLIEKGNVTVNDKVVNKNYKTKLNDIIYLSVPEPENIDIEPENIPIDVIYEDNDIIVVNKPQNMVVHPAPGHFNGTLVNALMYHCGNNLSGINGILRPGIVHRIDKDTSGILVAAKSDIAHKSLSLQLADHSMTRIYYAIVFNNFKEDEGTVNFPIGRHPTERKRMTVTDKNSRNAVTHYKVLSRYGKFCFIQLKLETGRTHQIRVHMSHIGHPLLGDAAYGSKKQPFNLEGQTLHAGVLGFIHPVSNEYMEFKSELPDYFKNLLLKLNLNVKI